MPSVYTIEGTRRKKRGRKTKFSTAQERAQARMKRAAKRCKGETGRSFKTCMRSELKK